MLLFNRSFITKNKKMSALQRKQQPSIHFHYSSSPTASFQKLPEPSFKPYNYSPVISKDPKIRINPIQINPSSQSNLKSHIKIVDDIVMKEKKEKQRRHRIFQEVGEINRQSKSRQKNKSFNIFNDNQNYDEVKTKAIIFTEKTFKQQDIQTDDKYVLGESVKNIQKQEKISTFNPIIDNSSLQTLKVSKIKNNQVYNHNLSSSNQNKEKINMDRYGPYMQKIVRDLDFKEKELSFLKLQLQRYKRCEKLTLQNESIYKRLVQKLETINNISLIQPLNESQQVKSFTRRPASMPKAQHSFTETTRFIFPQTQRKQQKSNKAQSRSQTPEQVGHQQLLRYNLNKTSEQIRVAIPQQGSKTVTFYKQKKHQHRNTKRQNNDNFQQKILSSIEQSRRKYQNHIDYIEIPIKDRLSEINKQLQNKYHPNDINQSRMRISRHSLYYSTRGRSISNKMHENIMKYL